MATIPMEDLLRLVVEEEASDLHLSVGVPPTLRLKGMLTALNTAAADRRRTRRPWRAASPATDQIAARQREGSVDFGFAFRETDRFRVSVFRRERQLRPPPSA